MNNYIVMFSSRNKDNKGLPGYHQRNRCFFADPNADCEMIDARFKQFVAQGVKDELSRCYISVNPRNMTRAKNKLIAELAMNDSIDLAKIESISISLAMEADCAADKRWMFDIDTQDMEEIALFTADIQRILKTIPSNKRPEILSFEPTLRGYHLIISRGFDTRELLERWKEKVSLKRDDFTLITALRKKV